jgi:hypothetical protein
MTPNFDFPILKKQLDTIAHKGLLEGILMSNYQHEQKLVFIDMYCDLNKELSKEEYFKVRHYLDETYIPDIIQELRSMHPGNAKNLFYAHMRMEHQRFADYLTKEHYRLLALE